MGGGPSKPLKQADKDADSHMVEKQPVVVQQINEVQSNTVPQRNPVQENNALQQTINNSQDVPSGRPH